MINYKPLKCPPLKDDNESVLSNINYVKHCEFETQLKNNRFVIRILEEVDWEQLLIIEPLSYICLIKTRQALNRTVMSVEVQMVRHSFGLGKLYIC